MTVATATGEWGKGRCVCTVTEVNGSVRCVWELRVDVERLITFVFASLRLLRVLLSFGCACALVVN